MTRGTAQAPEEISSWDDFFSECAHQQATLASLEDHVRQWYQIMYGYTDAPDVNSRHDSHFWEQEPRLGSHMVGLAIKLAVAGAAVGAIVHIVLGILAGAAVFAGPLSAWIFPVLLGLVIGAVIGLAPGLIRKSLCEKAMTKDEEALRSFVSYMPPKYRNAFCADAFFDMWSTYGVGDINQAIDVCDDHISRNRQIYRPIQLMADVPYAGAGGAVATFTGKPHDWEHPDTSDPDLPSDIAAHETSGVDDAEQALQDLIGLDSVKKQVRQMRNRIDFYKGRHDDFSGNNMVFLGSAGTGKTSVARIVTKILYDYGYIHANRIVECDGEYLKSGYVGQTGARTQAIVNYAMGGVLFIDEAYLLYNDNDNSSTGAEAIGVLLKAMEDNRNDIVVIFAGYEDPMNRLLASNEGFASRIRYKIQFSDYAPDELMQIFDLFLSKADKDHEYRLSENSRDAVTEEFAAERAHVGFGNARAVRNAVDVLLDIHADRFVEGKTAASDKYVITDEDVAEWVSGQRKQAAADGRNLMATLHIDPSIINPADLKEHTHEGSSDPDKDMERLVGLETVKQELAALRAQAEFYSGDEKPAMGHMAFLGPAGTGKSTMAKIVTGYLYKMGYIRDNRYVDITGDFLRGGYVGHTGKRTQATIEYATGGVLFIDEAYLLRSSNDGDAFGNEAIGVLVDAMEKKRDSLVVILAGYTDAMESLFEVNTGLKSRISTVWHFTPYTLNQLCQIFRTMAWYDGFTCDAGIFKPLAMQIKPQTADPQFGNARSMREILGKVEKNHILRFSQGAYTKENKMTLFAQDL